MRTSTNLGLSLPDLSDYINAKRDISDNLEIIDDAFGGGTDLTSGLTYGSNVSYDDGYVVKIGKIVIVNLRVKLSDTLPAGGRIVESGMPLSATNNNKNIVFFQTNQNDVIPYLLSAGQVDTLSNSQSVPSGSSISLNGVYISQ